MAETRIPQEVPLDVTLRDNNNTTDLQANQTNLTYSTPKPGPKPAPAEHGGDQAPKGARWSFFNRRPGDKTDSIN